MKQLSKLIENPFEDEKITISRLYNFAVYMRTQMQLNPAPNPEWAAAQNQLNDAITPVQAALDEVDINKTQQKGKTVTVDSVVAAFQAAIDQYYYQIVAVFPPNTPQYQEFFPQGKSEYGHLTRANSETLMNRMKTATAAHAGPISNTIVTAFAGFPAQYTSARSTQLTAIGTTDSSIDDKGDLQAALAAACWHALAYIIYVYANDTTTIETYYDQSLLLPPQGNRHFYTMEVGGNADRTISLPGLTMASTIELECPGTAPAEICLPPTPGTPCAGATQVVAPGQKHTFNVEEFSSPGATSIRIKNPTPGTAKYVLRVHIN